MSIRERVRKIKHLQHRYYICVLENPSNIINIASAIRNISAFGVEKLYIVGKKNNVKDFAASRSNKRLSKISVGANRWVFVRCFKTTTECMAYLKNNLYTIAVTSPYKKKGKNVYLYEGDFTQRRLAIWFGSESNGISEEAIDGADFCIQIPMGGIVESLNLGTSTGIVLSFVGYQRLKYIYENKKTHFKPKSLERIKMRSWHEFLKNNPGDYSSKKRKLENRSAG